MKQAALNTFGTDELCGWRVAPGRFWIQTRQSSFSRKLSKRLDARCVKISGSNCYLRTFEIRGTRRKVERIIERYLASAPDQFSAFVAAQDRSKIVPGVKTAGASIREVSWSDCNKRRRT